MAIDFTADNVCESVFRNKWKLILVPSIILALTVVVILFFPRTYRSEAKLFLQVGRESLGIDPTATTGATISLMQSDRDEEVKSAIEVLGSRGLLVNVVDRLGAQFVLNAGDSNSKTSNGVSVAIKNAIGQAVALVKSIDPIGDREEAIIEIEKNLSVKAERNSTVLVITYDSESPLVAQKVLDTLIDVYQSEHQRIHRNPDSGVFFAEQQELLQRKHAEAKETLSMVKNRIGVASIDGRRSAIEAQLQAIQLEQIQTEQEMAATSARTKQLNSQLGMVPERETASRKSIPNEGADLLRDKFYANQMRLMDYKSRLTQDHPLLVATEKQVEDAKRVIEDQQSERHETVDDINPIHRSITTDLRQQESLLAGLVARTKQLQEQFQTAHSAIEAFNRHEIEIDQLAQNEQVARDKYLQYTNNLEQARIDEALEVSHVSSVSVVQDATMAEKPVSPSKLLVGLGGLFIALASAVSMIFVREQLDDRLRRAKDIESVLGVPVLMTIAESSRNRRILTH